MSQYNKLLTDQKGPKIKDQAKLSGWPSVAAAYKELQPNVSYTGFRARIQRGMSVLEAGTAPRSNRGRPRLDDV